MSLEDPLLSGVSGGEVEKRIGLFPLYKRRWWLLFVFSINSTLQSVMWLTFNTAAERTKRFYDIDKTLSNLLPTLACISSIPAIFPVAWIFEKYGLRKTVFFGVIIQAFLSCLRIFAQGPESFWTVYIAQTLLGLSGTILMAAPPLLSANWFGPEERTTSTSIGSLANIFGSPLAFLLGFMLKKDEDILNLIYLEAIITVVATLLLLAYFPERPPTPPSLSVQKKEKESADLIYSTNTTLAASEVAEGTPALNKCSDAENLILNGSLSTHPHHGFLHSLRQLFTNVPFLLLCLTGGLSAGMFNGWTAMLSSILDFDQDTIGWLGFASQTAGIVGGILIGRVTDKFHRKHKIILVVLLFALSGR
eukprot:TRINITY_DN761_c0_g1_i1.p1 TRINITY_DN761_c0_g1~~TRINITY_DN761_c0_g1_i1.p1  ORF type:complete len:363 (-),score=54.50 TRINITY_DN761_c0_g1_i1:906-1994(-)